MHERAMGLEPTISCLGSMRSTTELRPLSLKIIPEFIKHPEEVIY
jgi:hypothetical protein